MPQMVILAGGISSRMKKAHGPPLPLDPRMLRDALEKPKSMIRVGYLMRPFLDYLLYNVREAGYRDVVIVVGEHDRDVRKQYGQADRNNFFKGLLISYAVQTVPAGRRKPLGTADALLQALRLRTDWKGKKLTVCNSDNLYSREALRSLKAADAESAMIDYDRIALEFDQERIEQFAVVKKDGDGNLRTLVEKPSREQIEAFRDPSGRIGVSMNVFRFRHELILPLLDEVPLHPVRHEKELPEAVRLMVERFPGVMACIPRSEHVPDLTNQKDIVRVQDYLKREYPNFSGVW